jgi:hypothetical protein
MKGLGLDITEQKRVRLSNSGHVRCWSIRTSPGLARGTRTSGALATRNAPRNEVLTLSGLESDDCWQYLQGAIREYCAVRPKPLEYFENPLTEFMAKLAPPAANPGSAGHYGSRFRRGGCGSG